MTINVSIPNITSWRTTVVGLLSAFVAAVSTYSDGSLTAAMHDFRVQMAVIVALIGLLSKDSNVTGGTKPATDEAKERLAKSNGHVVTT